jgi:ferredoxin-NADP reductase
VKAAAGGRVSQHLVRDLVPGTYLPLGLPQGDFVLPDAVPVRPLFITAGSGITPIMSMLRSYAARGPLPSVAHLHYAPHRYDVIFGTELQELAEAHPRYRLHLVYTREHSRAAHSSARRSPRSCGWRSRRLHPLRRDAARLMSPAPHGPEPRRRRCRDRTGRRAERKPTLTARRASGV